MGRKIVSTIVFVTLWACTRADREAAESPADQPGPASAPVVEDDRPVVLFLGTSLTAGYGLPETDAFPALIQHRIDSLGYGFRVQNAGVSGETSAGGLARLDWLLQQPVAVLVLELGANDGLRGLDIDALRANLQAIIDRTRDAYPEVRIVIAGMEAPPNLGPRFTAAFRETFVQLAERNGAAPIPFLLDGVAAIPELNQSDGIHPTAEGHRIVAANVWKVIQPVLEELGPS